MPVYLQQGTIPKKRHTQFHKSDGTLYYEELMSRRGFAGPYSNLYHLRMPTSLMEVGELSRFSPVPLSDTHRARHVQTSRLSMVGDAVYSRVLMFYNQEVLIHKAHVNSRMSECYRNAHYDEVLYIQKGEGILTSQFGELGLSQGDYVVIPRGVIWKLSPDDAMHLLVIESATGIQTPKRYKNEVGQHLEHSPFCERDFRFPTLTDPIDKVEPTPVLVRTVEGHQRYVYNHHPFDVVGWDGTHFPWVLNINDFEPIIGSIHQPPPVHQTFEADGFVICSFVTRLYDFHPEAIPAPYPHSNVDSDEIIFYSHGEFMSRKGIELESITFHPMGLPHGPQPGKYEASIGKTKTEELAVMIDTFKPLNVAEACLEIDDPNYPQSWLPDR